MSQIPQTTTIRLLALSVAVGAQSSDRSVCTDPGCDGPSNEHRSELKDKAFYETYSSPETQARMLLDRPRTRAYFEAVKANRGRLKGKTVLDVGCGTGVLSLFVAKAGAAKVICVEYTDVAELTREVVAANGMKGRVQVIQGAMEDVDIGVEQVDVIISEWMGYMGLFEGMYKSVLWARDRYLVPGGLMLPTSMTLFVAAARETAPRPGKLASKFQKPFFGLDFTPLVPVLEGWDAFKTASARADWRQGSYPEIAQVPDVDIITTPAKIAKIDMTTTTTAALEELESTFSMTATRSGAIDRFVGWFSCEFDTGRSNEAVVLDTAPTAPVTHWHQMVFHLANPLSTVSVGDAVVGAVVLQMSGQFHREMNVHFKVSQPVPVMKSFTVVIVPDTTRWAGAAA